MKFGMFEMNLGHGNDDAPSMPYYGEYLSCTNDMLVE